MAQALIDLNAGLRGWADGVDEGIGTITDSLATIRKLSDARPSSSAAVPVDEAGVAAIRDQLKETADLSLYLTDQIEDLDAVLNKLGELPERVEGVVTQAMRRTLTARAKIEQEAGSVLDDVASSLDGTVERLVEALGVLEGGDVRRLALAQVELTSRVESMQDTLQSRIDGIELGYRQMLEALARAIDRSSRGQEPRALEAVAKAVVPRPSRKPAVKKATKSTRGKRKRTAARRAEPTE
jgi:hypothetical protein